MNEKLSRNDLNKLLDSIDIMLKNENMKDHLRETKDGLIDIAATEKRYKVDGTYMSIVKLRDLPVYYIKYKDEKEDYSFGFDSKNISESENGAQKKFNNIVIDLNLKVNHIILKGIDIKV